VVNGAQWHAMRWERMVCHESTLQLNGLLPTGAEAGERFHCCVSSGTLLPRCCPQLKKRWCRNSPHTHTHYANRCPSCFHSSFNKMVQEQPPHTLTLQYRCPSCLHSSFNKMVYCDGADGSVRIATVDKVTCLQAVPAGDPGGLLTHLFPQSCTWQSRSFSGAAAPSQGHKQAVKVLCGPAASNAGPVEPCVQPEG